MRLLLVEDSVRLAALLGEAVREAGWCLDAVGTLAEAEAAIAGTNFDLILLDLGLPDGDGLNLLRAIRRAADATPVLILTARGTVEERIAGLDAGADDYLVKPFHHREFLARCRAMLRRSPTALQPVLVAGRLAYDPSGAVLTAAGEPVALPPRERALCEALMRDVGRLVPRRRLETTLSAYDSELTANALDLAVSRLRKRLDGVGSGVEIATVRGLGYLMRECASESAAEGLP